MRTLVALPLTLAAFLLVAGCSSDTSGTSKCKTTAECPKGDACVSGKCVECTSDAQCMGSDRCVGGRCAGCTSDAQCTAPASCGGGGRAGVCDCPDRDGDGRTCDDCNDNDP